MTLKHNGLVAQLATEDQRLIERRCKPVELRTGDTLSAPHMPNGHVYFLTTACVALVVRHSDGSGLAVGLTGHEGVVGLQHALGMGSGNLTLHVQRGGTAFSADGEAMQRLIARRAHLLRAFAIYLWGLSQEVASLAAASQTHDIKARLANWILLSHARNGHDDLFLTHAHLADMLGVRRAGVTLAAVELKEMGLVDYQRGRIHILDMDGLRAVARRPALSNGLPHA
ncbi:MAG: Crp/Fnr family transcriptional regulator [Hydrogenophaga sp.]|uniref:Crp/Fnr family transcriptional regulator n=1 Tax=Hydrogenophaga sp. TaxID=1904254 RepID=UPI0026396464|nr:Crp/Fnr family transcriptional regulator [Hydrogenophaga sp.]MDM7943602.1 Crp/Fnr family transcriptional regulator [Hydrogenophaga sp.]